MHLEKKEIMICYHNINELMKEYENNISFKNEYEQLKETLEYENFIETTTIGKKTNNTLIEMDKEYNRILKKLNDVSIKTRNHLMHHEQGNNS